MDVLKCFEQSLPFLQNKKILLAFSSGVDSTVLAYLCYKYKLVFSIAHVNYQLRGEDSEKDLQHAQKTANKYRVKLYTSRFSKSKNLTGTIQHHARNYRYQWFQFLKENLSYTLTLTAHHLDDSIETFIINSLRGTGAYGLRGILSNEENYRPLSRVSKNQILAFAKKEKLVWREDLSNLDTKYLRNNIRKNVLLPLQKDFHNYHTGFQKTFDHLSEQCLLLDIYANQLREKIFKPTTTKNCFLVCINKLNEITPLRPHLPLIFRPFGNFLWDDLYKIIFSTPGKFIASKKYKIHRLKKHLEISQIQKV